MQKTVYLNENGNRLEYIEITPVLQRVLIYNKAGYLIFEKKYNGERWLAEHERDGLVALGGFHEEVSA